MVSFSLLFYPKLNAELGLAVCALFSSLRSLFCFSKELVPPTRRPLSPFTFGGTLLGFLLFIYLFLARFYVLLMLFDQLPGSLGAPKWLKKGAAEFFHAERLPSLFPFLRVAVVLRPFLTSSLGTTRQFFLDALWTCFFLFLSLSVEGRSSRDFLCNGFFFACVPFPFGHSAVV